MKKYLAMAMALIMVLSSFCVVSFASDEPYQQNVDIIIKTQNNTLSRGAGPSGYEPGVDGDIPFTHIYYTDAEIETLTTGGSTAGFLDLVRVRAKLEMSYPVKTGYKYFVKYDARTNIEGTTKGVTGGGDYTHYAFTPAGSSSAAKSGDINPYNTYEASPNAGWGTVVMNPIPANVADITDSNRVFLADGTNKTGYIKMVYLGEQVIGIMQQTKAYCGTGYTAGGTTNYNFTITADDICKNHTFSDPKETGVEGVTYMEVKTRVGTKVNNAWVYNDETDKYVNLTTEQIEANETLKSGGYKSIYGTWSASRNCTPLKCACGAADCKSTEKINLAKQRLKNLSIDLANPRAVVKGNTYNNDTATAGKNGKIEITTNTATDEKTVVNSGETKNVIVNDYYDVVVKPVPDEGYVVDSLKVNGESVALTNGTYTLPVSEAATANNIEAKFKFELVDYTATRETADYFLGGTVAYKDTNRAYAYTTKNGLLKMFLQNDSTYASADTVDETEGYFQWKHNSQTRNEGEPGYTGAQLSNNASRLYLDFNFKVASDRTYSFGFDMTNPGTADAVFPYCQKNAISAPTAFNPDETVTGTAKGQNISTGAKITKGTILKTQVNAFKMTNNLGFTRTDSGTSAYYANLPRVEITNQMAYGSLPRFYGIKIYETIKYHNTLMDIGEGTATVVNHTLNYGDEIVALENMDCIGIESGLGADVAINAPDNKVIDTLVWTPVSGTPVDFTDAAKGKATASISLSYITASGALTATYKDNPLNVQSTYKYITLSSNNTVLLNGGQMANQYPTILAYDDDGNEYDITGSRFLTIESDNNLVFKAENNRISTTGQFGMATITATYDNLEGDDVSATVMYIRTSGGNRSIGIASNFKSTAVEGHVPGTPSYSYSYDANLSTGERYAIRTYSNYATSMDWATAPDRTTTAWFYDEGIGTQNAEVKFTLYHRNNTLGADSFDTAITAIGINNTADTTYHPSTVNAVPRTKGWHQIVTTLTEAGQVKVFIDGVLVRCDNTTICTGSKSERNIELRATSTRGEKYQPTDYNIYSDFAILDYVPTKEQYSVTFDATNGSVSGSATVAHGETAEYTLIADEGYSVPATVEIVDYAKINTRTIPVTGNKFSIKPSDDTFIKVEFVEKTVTAPAVSSHSASSTGAFQKEIIGVDQNPISISANTSITAYSIIDEGYGHNISEYGIEVEKDGKTIALKGIGSSDDGRFAIIAFGNAITKGNYKTRAYVKYGDETAYGEWNTVNVE